MKSKNPFVGLVLAVFKALLGKGPSSKASAKRRPTQKTTSGKSSVTGDLFHWPGTDDFDFAIVGESNYQGALKALAGDHGNEAPTGTLVATLTPEDDNPHDDKAICVTIAGKTVGYLSRSNARSFRRRLGAKQLTGVDTTCNAIITGGYVKRSGERVLYGVQLDLKPFE